MTKNRANNVPDSSNADLHRVRDILFGEHERKTAERIAELEKQVKEQAAAIADLSVELHKQTGAVEQRLAAAIAAASAGDGESREALREELMAELEELRGQKVDRDALAGLLGGLADRLGRTAKDVG